jgi:hypothetical protein
MKKMYSPVIVYLEKIFSGLILVIKKKHKRLKKILKLYKEMMPNSEKKLIEKVTQKNDN